MPIPDEQGTRTVNSADLTEAQRNALRRFEPGVKRTAFPDINPRTASALWSKGLVKGEVIGGTRQFILTETGEAMRKKV